MKIINSLLLLMFFFVQHSFCQSGGGGGTPAAPTIRGANSGLISSNFNIALVGKKKRSIDYETALEEYESIDGTPFMFKESIPVQLLTKDDALIENINLNIDLYGNEILAGRSNDESIHLDPIAYREIRTNYDGEEILLKKVNLNNINKFQQILVENDDFIFFKEPIVKLSQSESHVPGVEPVKKFVHSSDYFIRLQNEIHRVKLKKGQFLTELDYFAKKDIKTLQKSLGIKKLKSESDYIKLLKEM